MIHDARYKRVKKYSYICPTKLVISRNMSSNVLFGDHYRKSILFKRFMDSR